MSKPRFTALLIDTISIQQYIFSSNKLKENLGASFIVEELIYNTLLEEAILQWETEDSQNQKQKGGYVGGGNALQLLSAGSNPQALIRIYTTLLLEYFPGLRTAFAIQANFDTESEFKEHRKKLNKGFVYNKNLQWRNITLFKHGIANDCALSNEAQEASYKTIKNISKVSWSKLNACDLAQQYINQKHVDELGDVFEFTAELDKLGQPEDKGYIAVVHLDGNGMGARFLATENLSELSELSEKVKDKAGACMKALIQKVAGLYDNKGFFTADKSYQLRAIEKKENSFYLPIRPIVSGGDDVTFVCEGRLGIFLAEKLIHLFNNPEVGGMAIPSCAGIAIVHTKYPFYKAYQLAEELTAQAKKEARKINGTSCWLNFISFSGGFSGSLEDIQKQMFETPNGSLAYGPYRVDIDNDENNKSFTYVKDTLKRFAGKWPLSKLKELRDVLRADSARQIFFIKEAEAAGLFEIDEVKGLFTRNGENKNPVSIFYDMVELTDFYPQSLL